MSLGPSPARSVRLVERITWSRRPLIAAPRISSDAPSEYTSAVSKKLAPASRQMSIRRFASATSLLPHAENSGPLPPNVPAPKPSTGTLKPELPRKRVSISKSLGNESVDSRACLQCRCGTASGFEAHAPQHDGKTRHGQQRRGARDRRESRTAFDHRSAQPRTDRIAEVEGGDVEAGGEALAPALRLLQHAQLQRRDGGERRGAEQAG